MKRKKYTLVKFFIIVILAWLMLGCECTVPPGTYSNPRLYINGEGFGAAYVIFEDDYAVIVLQTVLLCMGGEHVKSPYYRNNSTDVISINGVRLFFDGDNELLIREDNIDSMMETLETEGKKLSRLTASDYSLLPWHNEHSNQYYVSWEGGVFVDHITLKNVLGKVGIHIDVECDFENEKLYITTIQADN